MDSAELRYRKSLSSGDMVPQMSLSTPTHSYDNAAFRESPEGCSDGGLDAVTQNNENGTILSTILPEIDKGPDWLNKTNGKARIEPIGAEMHEMLEPLLADDEASSTDSEQKILIVPKVTDESSFMIFLQVIFPFLVAGAGMVGAGLVLDMVQHWDVFTKVSELFILVPALLGLKGNLEMTLASRLSTLANLGKMDTYEDQFRVICSNLALIEAQATVVAFLASSFAIVLAWIPEGIVDWHHALLLCASSLTTACIASLVLGVIMVAVVVLSRKYHINPDNVATPIAASLGDLTTLTVLAAFGTLFLRVKLEGGALNGIVVAGWLLLTPLWIYLAAKDIATAKVLRSGWSPVIFAMLISSAGGFILKFAVSTFSGIAVFQPVINGVGGNLVAVQASRISTSLHQSSTLGKLIGPHKACYYWNPFRAFFSNDLDSRAARVLILIVVPGHLVFNYLIHLLQAGHTTISLNFTLIYITAALLQVISLLYICQWMVRQMWQSAVDPDNSAIPYLTALGDLLGTGLLALAFMLLYALGDRDDDLGD